MRFGKRVVFLSLIFPRKFSHLTKPGEINECLKFATKASREVLRDARMTDERENIAKYASRMDRQITNQTNGRRDERPLC